MKKFLLSLVILTTLFNANASEKKSIKTETSHWMSSFKDAQKLAIATNKLILIDFWATWCGPCKRMDADTWSKQEVKELMTNFVALKIDIDSDTELARKYSANRIPYVVIVDPMGEIIYEETGYKDKNKMMKILGKYSISTHILQDDFIKFTKSKEADLAISMAEKYFDYSIYVDKSIKNDFLKIGRRYLKIAKKIAKKKVYKEKLSQRVNLLDKAYIKLIRGKYEKALDYLNKDTKEEKILATNKSLYNFLYFTVFSKLKNREQAKIWYEKLKETKEAKILIAKSRKL